MRGKRAKQYKKLIRQFEIHHGFREPYQVLVDADIVRDAQRFTMDLQASLERTLHGKVKIMITQCSIRHLYEHNTEPGAAKAIELAKTFERRRCGHKPEDYAEPLSTLECLSEVVTGKKGSSNNNDANSANATNKHRYVVASQDLDVRRYMRAVTGVPLIYITRSVMIMEPMSDATAHVGAVAERAKFRAELRKMAGSKRKRGEGESEKKEKDQDEGGERQGEGEGEGEEDNNDDNQIKKKKKKYGPKEPNPLSVKKKKKTDTATTTTPTAKQKEGEQEKKKRKRKHKTKPGETESQATGATETTETEASRATGQATVQE